MDIYNINLNRFSEIVDNGKSWKVYRYWTPKWAHRKALESLLEQVADLTDARPIRAFNDRVDLLAIANEAYNMLAPLIVCAKEGKISEDMKRYALEEYAIQDPTTRVSIERLESEYDRLRNRYEALKESLEAQAVPRSEKGTFADVVAMVEAQLEGKSIDRESTTLYMFMAQRKIAQELIKKQQLNTP